MLIKIVLIILAGYITFELFEHVTFPLAVRIFKGKPPDRTGKEGMIGKQGIVRSWSKKEGVIFIHGALWNATSDTPLASGDQVIVRKVTGLKLLVSPLSDGKERQIEVD